VTLASVEELVANEGDGWSYMLDALSHSLEQALASPDGALRRATPPGLLALGPDDAPPDPFFSHVEWVSLLAQRTGELHAALASDAADPAFAPEPMTPVERLSLYHGARSQVRQIFRQVREAPHSEAISAVLRRERDIGERLRIITAVSAEARRIRVHGDYHLGQVLWTGKDIVLIDFEGEPARSLGQRRLKRPPAVDLAGMIRSFHYAARTVAMRADRDLVGPLGHREIEPWLNLWYRWVSAAFLRAYLEVPGVAELLPSDRRELALLLDFFLLEKAVAELGYEANARPDWVGIPARGILDVLDTGQ
jgi:maltose alpha-D-glucosyltransferase/alpha-amylase